MRELWYYIMLPNNEGVNLILGTVLASVNNLCLPNYFINDKETCVNHYTNIM